VFHETLGRGVAALGRLALGRGGELAAEPERILALSLQKIGDAVTTEPALRILADKWPRASLEVAAAASLEPGPDMGACEVFAMIPQVKRVHPVRRRRDLRALAGTSDLVLVFGLRARDAWAGLRVRGGRGVALGYGWGGRGAALDKAYAPPPQIMLTATEARESGARAQHELWGELLVRAGIASADDVTRAGAPRLVVPEKAARDAAALLVERDVPERFVVLAPWNAQPHYRWPEERWVSLASALSLPKVIVGGHARDEVEHAARIAKTTGAVSFAGQLPLDRTAALLARAALVVALDSGPAHVARAVGAPTVVLFGPGSPPVWAPPGARVLQRTDLCHGCRQPRCYRSRRECLDDLTVESVLAAAQN
jgi:ADP-heptose:LPS heptosyltransferase